MNIGDNSEDPNNIGKCLNCGCRLEDRQFMYDYNNNFCQGQCKDSFIRNFGTKDDKDTRPLPKLQYFKI